MAQQEQKASRENDFKDDSKNETGVAISKNTFVFRYRGKMLQRTRWPVQSERRPKRSNQHHEKMRSAIIGAVACVAAFGIVAPAQGKDHIHCSCRSCVRGVLGPQQALRACGEELGGPA